MKRAQVAIVGGGLSGIYAACLLQRSGIACVVLEARGRLGGRILSHRPEPLASPESNAADPAPARLDLGPTWFWPDFQPRMAQLIDALGLQAFAQHTAGDLLWESAPQVHATRHRNPSGAEPRAMRLAGGMMALVDALARQLPDQAVILEAPVSTLRRTPDGSIALHLADDAQPAWLADHVILALPPRLAHARLAFVPELDAATEQIWQATPTWMAGHAKALAVYARPFWREAGLSGMASSRVGPLVEIHDACAEGGAAALFGFFGIPAEARAAIPPDAQRAAVLAQLTRLFGAEAAHPVDFQLQDWASEPHTATVLDWVPPNRHPSYGFAPMHQCVWSGRVLLAGTEAASGNGGYLEGALEAAEQAVATILQCA